MSHTDGWWLRAEGWGLKADGEHGSTNCTETRKVHAKAWGGGRLSAQNYKKIMFKNYKDLKVQKCRSALTRRNPANLIKIEQIVEIEKNNKNSSAAVCSLRPHCYLTRLCLRTRSRTTTVLSMGSLNEPQKASEAKTGKNNFFLELNINDSFLMNINCH